MPFEISGYDPPLKHFAHDGLRVCQVKSSLIRTGKVPDREQTRLWSSAGFFPNHLQRSAPTVPNPPSTVMIKLTRVTSRLRWHFRALQFARGIQRITRRSPPPAPLRTTPASLARAACCASSPYSGGHVKHKIWRHLPRMPSAERREDHSLPWHTSAHKLRVTRSSAFEAAEKWLSLLRRLGGKEDILRQANKCTSMIDRSVDYATIIST